ncbi:uncharacterized protein FTJAE_7204 [Fusarium tjaetaba]|uniref:Uncharacterized protein n=1 Tax=Fusarium tjaetaba TaxID=1567544 RepID=A0A8H5RIX2_9HYPO|nr:uncharacterized protein FTJAE_7204 [Fusarium tjaetaba]KAF5633307.1 hypothetical protein FTJAE_7204 [Fusarium tjaetaba]
MDPDDPDRHVAEPTSLTGAIAEAELASGSSQQVENNSSSNYMESLDLSLLGSPDFDFSCLMDLDETGEATQEPEQLDSMMLDAPAFEAPSGMDDLTVTQILTGNVFHGSDHPGTNLYSVHDAPQHQGYIPQSQVGLDTLTSENCQFSSETFKIFQNPPVESFAYPVEMTRIMPEAPQSSGFGDQRFIQMNAPPTQVQVPLPRPSRPRRRGPLTREQAEGQALARENGVCIRCRRNNITCVGGIPCKACLGLRKPRLWKVPCTKAQFLDIIESGSFFYKPSMNEALFTERLVEEMATMALAFARDMSKGDGVSPKNIDFPWTVAFEGLRTICFPDGRYQKPRMYMVRKTEAQLLKAFPIDTAGSPCLLVGNNRLKWTRAVAAFCGDRCLENPYEEDLIIDTRRANDNGNPLEVFVKTSWLLSRYLELHLFRYLQNAANNPSKDIHEQRSFAYSALYLLGHSFSTSSNRISGLNISDEMFKGSITDHLDRERRVRLALWVYVSITVGQLPSEANFWNNLPKELKAFRGGLPKKFRESFDGFDNSLRMNMKIELDSKTRFLQKLDSGQQTQELIERPSSSSDIDPDRSLWQRMVENTTQGIHEICHLHSGELASLEDRVSEYEQIEAERLFLPTDHEHFAKAAENAFGTILALARLPIRSQQTLPIQDCEVLRPSFLRFQAELRRFMGRLSSDILPCGMSLVCLAERPFVLYGADNMHLNRWQELEDMMGGGIYLVGNTMHPPTRKTSHAFLDIATVADIGSDEQFLRLKRLLQKNGSWLRQVCGQLNGLVQAMKQIGHELHEEKRLRAFQIILRRKVREVFGHHEASCKPHSLHCQDPRGIFFFVMFKKHVRSLFGSARGWRGVLYENFQSILARTMEEMHDGHLQHQSWSIMGRVIFTLLKMTVQFKLSGSVLAMAWPQSRSEDESSRLEMLDAMGEELLYETESFRDWMECQLRNDFGWALEWK